MNTAAGRRAFVGNDGTVRKIVGDNLARRMWIQRPIWKIGLPGYTDMQRLLGCLHCIRESLQRDRAILVGVCEKQNLAILWRAPGGLVGVCEETHRRTRADQDQLLCPFHEFDNLFGEIGNAFNLNSPGTALATRGKCVAGDPRSGRRCDAASRVEAAFL